MQRISHSFWMCVFWIAMASPSWADFVFDPDASVLVDARTGEQLPEVLLDDSQTLLNTNTFSFVPVSEIGFNTEIGLGVPLSSQVSAPLTHAGSSSTESGTGVISILPIGDSITAGATTGARQRESYRPYLWQSIHTNGPDDVVSGDIVVDFQGEFTASGMLYFGDNSINNGRDSLSGPNPSLVNGNQLYLGPGNTAGLNGAEIPVFDDHNQGGRGLSTSDFLCSRPDCQTSVPGINGFDQTDVPSIGNAAKWVADHSPDIATIMLGANDIINSELFGQSTGGFTKVRARNTARQLVLVINELEKANPDVSIFVSQVPSQWILNELDEWVPRYSDDDNLDSDGDGVVDGPHNEVVWMNEAIATELAKLDSSFDVTLVDIDPLNEQWNPSHAQTWMLPGDGGVHPSTLGDEFIASRLFEAMGPALSAKTAIAAQAVPEPSSFLFIGMVGLLPGVLHYYRRWRRLIGA